MSAEEEASLLEPFREKAEKEQIVEVSEIKVSYERAVEHKASGSQIYYVLGWHGWRKVMPRSKQLKKPVRRSSRQKNQRKSERIAGGNP